MVIFRGKIAIAALLAVLVAAPVRAAMYKFVDENGVIHFTNVPSDPKYQPVVSATRRGAVAMTAAGRAVVYGGTTARTPAPDSFDEAIRLAARRYQVDPRLVKSVIRAESNFDYLAVSRKGAQGLMQLMPETAGDMQVSDPFDPQENINGGTRYLRKMLGLFNGNLHLALAAYNAGPTRVAALGRVPGFKETENYVRKVQLFYEEYKGQSSPY
ncbi:MAG: transglycosylase SLT domain-containing protein [Desulfobulbales bacterium]|nr:transglycosylase SLT domain-containing protein [Desulfobulbales bacterium]